MEVSPLFSVFVTGSGDGDAEFEVDILARRDAAGYVSNIVIRSPTGRAFNVARSLHALYVSAASGVGAAADVAVFTLTFVKKHVVAEIKDGGTTAPGHVGDTTVTPGTHLIIETSPDDDDDDAETILDIDDARAVGASKAGW